MGIKGFTSYTDDRFAGVYVDGHGSAPILGVILLLALTTVIATTIASVVFGMGLFPTTIHMVDWEFETTESTIVITHASGPNLDGTQVEVTGVGIPEPETLASIGPATWSPGTQAEIPVDIDHNTSVNLIWKAPTGERILLSRWSPPPGDVPVNTPSDSVTQSIL